jgi:hypothetical protein
VKDVSLKIGDEIVEFGEIYKIFKIKDGIIFYKPFFKEHSNLSTICSVPLQSLIKTKIRRPLPKRKFKKIMTKLSEPCELIEFDSILAKEKLQKNRISPTIQVLKELWLE